ACAPPSPARWRSPPPGSSWPSPTSCPVDWCSACWGPPIRSRGGAAISSCRRSSPTACRSRARSAGWGSSAGPGEHLRRIRGVGVTRDSSDRPTLYHALMGEAAVRAAIRPTELPRLSVLPSDADLVGAELELVAAEEREIRLREMLGPVRGDYEFILVDCPP